MLSVLSVDDHFLVRQGLKVMLNQEYRHLVFGEAGNSNEAAVLLARSHWDLVILEIALPSKDGFYILEEILRRDPSAREPRPVEGAPAEAKQAVPRSLLLDGQQRMTSLYQVALRGKVVETVTPKNKKVKRWFYRHKKGARPFHRT